MSIGLRTLVLHPDYTPVNMFPLATIPVEDAITRVIKGGAFTVAEHDRFILTQNHTDWRWPSVIVNKRMYKRRNASEAILKHETLYYRDHGLCMYCEEPLTTHNITCDHVVPRDAGGHHGWDNVVASCKRCNAEKANLPPKGRWQPKIKPYKPSLGELISNRKKFPVLVDSSNWIDFIGPWEGEVMLRNVKARMPSMATHSNR